MKEYSCLNCGKTVNKYPSQILKSGKVYCSKSCTNEHKTKHVYSCELCGSIFHRPVSKGVKVRFCSKKCAYIVLKKERNPLNCQCLVCKKKFHKTPFAIKNGEGKYCSYKCKAVGQTCVFNNTEPVHYYNQSFWKKLRKKVLKRDNYQCIRCGYKPQNTSELQVNHIVFRQLGGSDEMANLETLCKSCHAKTDSKRLKEITGNSKARMRDFSELTTML